MAQYLTKEEIRLWRSSTEKITLEDYATRLGKEINPEKETHDIVDIVMSNETSVIVPEPVKQTGKIPVAEVVVPKVDKAVKPTEALEVKKAVEPKETEKPEKKEIIQKQPEQVIEKPVESKKVEETQKFSFKKKLTDREQTVFEYFIQNKGKTVFAKDLATVLNMPRDYVYKYIKNLREKIIENVLVNSEQGGFMFKP
jgi:predicted transcriptional regulator